MADEQATNRIRPRERDAITSSLRAGVVPSIGHAHFQVGRAAEVSALVQDLDRIADGGSAFRLIIGEYGSGKSFFLSLMRSLAHEAKLVTLRADLSPVRRLHATGGQARSLYAELMHNCSTKTKPDGGAMNAVVERFVTDCVSSARRSGRMVEGVVHERLEDFEELTGGYDFAKVVGKYWRAHERGDEELKSAAVRWLRGEYTSKTEARQALEVRTIVDDLSFYDHLKLFALFTRKAGYKGLLVCLDEMVNLYKLTNSQARKSNYEQILRILNDCLQGSVEGIGFLLGGTPDFLQDPRRGLYSYEALQSRLAENSFARRGLVDLTGPVIRLENLTPEDVYLLLTKLRHIYAGGDPERYLVPDEALTGFMQWCSDRIGDAYFRTPRSTIKAFLDLLAIVDQNPTVNWRDHLDGTVSIDAESNPDLEPLPTGSDDDTDPNPPGGRDDGLSSFRL